ncbi:MAG: hypothetical protein J5701_04345 [Bacteroidales bacterium]|nr:hypothetical protein [Bacteroidales bacterium]
MKKWLWLLLCLYVITYTRAENKTDISLSAKTHGNYSAFSQQRLVQFGIDFGFDVPLYQKTYGSQFKINQSLNFEIGAFARAGRQFYGQLGLYYFINKLQVTNLNTQSDSPIELGQLYVPALFVYGLPWGKKNMFTVKAGIAYQGLVRLTDNKIDFTKNDIRCHNLNFMTGVGLEISNITFNITYKKACLPLGKESGSRYYQDMLCFSIGIVI